VEHTHNPENETDEAVMRRQGQQHSVDQKNVLEIIDDAFTVQKVHAGSQEVPV
jgi:hypothetical protein